MQGEHEIIVKSSQETLSAVHDLTVADSALVAAETDYEDARAKVRRGTSSVLEDYAISIADARTGIVEADHSR